MKHTSTTAQQSVASYVTAAEYFPDWEARRHLPSHLDNLARYLVRSFSRDHILDTLAVLNKHLVQRGDADLENLFLASLAGELGDTLGIHLQKCRADRRDVVLFTRQGVLFAMRWVLRENDGSFTSSSSESDPLVACGLLVHILAVRTNVSMEGMAKDHARDMFTMEAVRNQLFNSVPLPAESIAVTRLLWRGDVEQQESGDASPWTLLTHALGADPDSLMAVAFGLYATVIDPSRPGCPTVDLAEIEEALGPGAQAILSYLSVDPVTVADQFSNNLKEERWDLLPFVERPVLRLGGRLLVLDGSLLMARITTGLFWLVHDHAKFTEGNRGREKWVAVWSRMVEEWVEVTVLSCAGPESNHFTEETFPKRYKGSRADLGVFEGNDVAIFEIFSGSTTVSTRFSGNSGSYAKDAEKMVLSKLRQVSGTLDELKFKGGFMSLDPPEHIRGAS